MDYRVRIDDTHNPKGPDGKGWNRMAIIGLGSHDRCALIPRTRQGAMDTLRGMARYGVPTAYSDCISNTPCDQCPIAVKEKDRWNDTWHLREDSNGYIWLLGNIEKGFAGFGYCYKTWAAIMGSIELPMLKRMKDEQGFYWVQAD